MSAPNNNFRWGASGTIGRIALAFYLILAGVVVLIGIAIPTWVVALLAIIAGILILTGY